MRQDKIFQIAKSILGTLCYADAFSYPLTTGELYRRLIVKTKTDASLFLTVLRLLEKNRLIGRSRDFHFLSGKNKIVNLRAKREKWTKRKLRKTRKLALLLRHIPTVKLAGLSGSVAAGNAGRNADIDFFIICASGTVWLTRFLILILSRFAGRRRRPEDKKVKDLFCFNMFIDENHLAIPAGERDLFSANEIMLMKPLFERHHTYNKFLAANKWTGEYFANCQIPFADSATKKSGRPALIYRLFDRLLGIIQLSYMKKKINGEIIRDGYLRFHPRDGRRFTLNRYHAKLKHYQSAVNGLIFPPACSGVLSTPYPKDTNPGLFHRLI